MSTIKFPIVFWRTADKQLTAATASGAFAAAVDSDVKGCLTQLRKYLVWKYSDRLYDYEPEFDEPQLTFFEVKIRPEYRSINEQVFPCEQLTTLRIPCVWGYRFDESIVCRLPTLDATFHCRKEPLMEGLVVGQVQRALQGLSPKQLSRFLAPETFFVDTLNVKVKATRTNMQRAKLPTLESVALPVGSRQQQRRFKQAWQRDDEIRDLVGRLQVGRGNLLLLGERGSGKTTLIANAVRQMQKQKGKVSDSESIPPDDVAVTDRFWLTDADRLIAGMKYVGQWEERLEQVIAELSEIRGVLCVESLQQLVHLGGRDAVDSVASFLIPYMQNNEIRIIAESTAAELDACRRLLPGFDALFEMFELDTLDREKAKHVLLEIANQFRMNHQVNYEIEAVDLCYRLFKRFMPYETFPGKCVTFWSDLFEIAVRKKESLVSRDAVIRAFVRRTGLPEVLLRDEVSLSPEEVSSFFRNRVIGQDLACHIVTNVITTFKAGLNDPNRPLGVQLFCGPTGVGKTEMAKALADYLFGSGDAENRLLRLDMSEYAGPGAGDRLLMQTDGSPSKFLQTMRDQPFSVVLFDEIEKANDEIFDVLMGVFDEGRLTDRWGRVTDFRSSIIVMTSNLGVRTSDPIGYSAQLENVFEKEVRQFFRPEFFNRFDAVVPFQPLELNSIQRITEIELKKIARRAGFKTRRIELRWTGSLVDLISKRGYDRRFGARPLQRVLETKVVTQVSRLLAESPDLSDTRISLDAVDGEVCVATDDSY